MVAIILLTVNTLCFANAGDFQSYRNNFTQMVKAANLNPAAPDFRGANDDPNELSGDASSNTHNHRHLSGSQAVIGDGDKTTRQN